MPIDEKLFKKLQSGFKKIEEWDNLKENPKKRVQLVVTIPIELKKQIENNSHGNMSRYVESIMRKAIQS